MAIELTTNGSVIGFGVPTQNNGPAVLQVDRSLATAQAHCRDAGTTTQPAVFTLKHASTGVPGVNFGAILDFQLHDSLNLMVEAGNINCRWTTATSAAVVSKMDFILQQTSLPITMMSLDMSGSSRGVMILNVDFFHSAPAGKISFFGAVGVVQQANISAAGLATVADAPAKTALTAVRNLLIAYGLAPATA